MYKSLVSANLQFRTLAGLCLVMAQGITGAPVMHPTATDAANATRFRHYDKNIPNAVCVLWFDHYGTYGPPFVYKNWGHVVVYVPGYGYASSSPVAGQTSGPWFYGSIREVEAAFNCTFRFWSEDINYKRVCEPVGATAPIAPPAPTKKRKKGKMDYTCFKLQLSPGNFQAKVFCLANGEEHNFQAPSEYIENIAKSYQCGPTSIVTRSHFDQVTRELAATRKRLDSRK